MCMRQQSAPTSAATPASSGSNLRADTSFTIVAPASSATRATAALVVSIEMRTSRAPPYAASRSTTGSTRLSSSSCATGSAPGRVDSPPTSRIAAPSLASRRPCSTAASASRNSPPSENESGVTFTTPMISGARIRSANGELASHRRERLVDHGDREVHLVVADRERRGHAQAVSRARALTADEVHRQAAAQALLGERTSERVGGRARVAVLHQLDAREQAQAAHVADRLVPLLELAQAGE